GLAKETELASTYTIARVIDDARRILGGPKKVLPYMSMATTGQSARVTLVMIAGICMNDSTTVHVRGTPIYVWSMNGTSSLGSSSACLPRLERFIRTTIWRRPSPMNSFFWEHL